MGMNRKEIVEEIRIVLNQNEDLKDVKFKPHYKSKFLTSSMI